MAPPQEAGDHVAIRARRLIYRASHRGTLELDLLLGPFATAHAGQMSTAELDAFEQLLDETETELQAWLLGQEPAPDHVDLPLLRRILEFKQTAP